MHQDASSERMHDVCMLGRFWETAGKNQSKSRVCGSDVLDPDLYQWNEYVLGQEISLLDRPLMLANPVAYARRYMLAPFDDFVNIDSFNPIV